MKWVTKNHLGEEKGKVRVRGKVNLAVSRKRCVVEQNCMKILSLWMQRDNGESFGGVSEKKGKVRVRGKVNLAISRKRSVVEQNGIKISTLWVQRGIEQSLGGVLEKKDKVRGKDKKREVNHGD